MQSQPVSSNRGVSGRRFLTITLGLLVVTFVIGMLLAPSIDTNFAGIGLFVLKVLVRLGLIIAGTAFWGYIFFTEVADLKRQEIITALHSRDNLSYGVALGGIFGVLTLAVGLAGATTFKLYLYEILTKGSVGFALSVTVTMVIARLLGVKSLDSFSDTFIKDPRNNQMVVLLVFIWMGIMFVAMKAG